MKTGQKNQIIENQDYYFRFFCIIFIHIMFNEKIKLGIVKFAPGTDINSSHSLTILSRITLGV